MTPDARPSRRALDVAALPGFAFGHQGLIWWGTIGFMVIEGSMFLMAIVTYFFLRLRTTEWPPGPEPDLTLGTVNLAILLISTVPNHLAKKAAERFDVASVRRLLLICLGLGIAFIAVRWFEFSSLSVRWDSNAYGSIVWFLLALHTAHLVTDVVETGVLTALMFTAHVEPRRLVDVSENGLYWYFVVLSWLPIYATIYLAPRWL
jgi:cytochrome c oxidase subunit III